MYRAFLIALPLLGAVPQNAKDSSHPRQNPPSSLEPDQGKVMVRHSHRRATSCYVHTVDSQKKRCRSKRQDAPAGTTVTLSPVDRSGVATDDERQPIVVDLANDARAVEQIVTIAIGDWDVVWSDSGPTKRLRVVSGEQTDVQLRTTTGECNLDAAKEACTLDATHKKRVVTIQEGREVR